MPSSTRRHTNQDFARRAKLILVELSWMIVMGYMLIGMPIDRFEKGIWENMPTYQYKVSTDTIFLPASHVLHLELPQGGLLLCEGKPISLHQLPKLIEGHLYRGIDRDTIHFVSLRTERTARYATYLAVKDIVLAQQHDQLNELALQNFGRQYSRYMPFQQRRVLHQKLKLGFLEWVREAEGEKLRVAWHPV